MLNAPLTIKLIARDVMGKKVLSILDANAIDTNQFDKIFNKRNIF